MLVFVTGLIGAVAGVTLGAVAALRKDSWFDHVTSVAALAVTSLPEFVVAIGLIILLSTVVWHVLPAVSLLPPGTYAWSQPELLILPVATLVIVIIPYIFRMMRAAMIEALESDYVEMARLKGVPERRIVLRHALPNAIAPTIQVIGLNFLYLAGGVVVVEFVFNYPGIGQGLVFAVANRDIPVIQFIVVVLAAFYVCMNILTDVIALLATPRRRIASRLWPSPRPRRPPRRPHARPAAGPPSVAVGAVDGGAHAPRRGRPRAGRPGRADRRRGPLRGGQVPRRAADAAVRQAVGRVPAGRRLPRPGRAVPGAERRVGAAADGRGRHRARRRHRRRCRDVGRVPARRRPTGSSCARST